MMIPRAECDAGRSSFDVRPSLSWALALLVFVAAVQSAGACSIPVFRYALEHWQPDPFMVVVFHRGGLTAEGQAAIDELESPDQGERPPANVMVKSIDLDREGNPSLQRLWELQETATLPWMAVHAPVRSGPPQRIWGGEYRPELLRQLVDSPVRRKIAQRLIAGDSVVWVLVDSADSTKNAAAFAQLTSQLSHLEKTLRLPAIEAADFGELSVVPESLRVAFSIERVAGNDPAEAMFVVMLLHAAGVGESMEMLAAPVAVPVFGRGRAHDALVGAQFEPQLIEDACRFLIEACQCTVKAQNPGIDLLMAVDWEAAIEPTFHDEKAPPLVGLQGFASPDSEPPADAARATGAIEREPGKGTRDTVVDHAPASRDANPASRTANAEGASASTSAADSLQRSVLFVLTALAALVLLVSLILLNRTR